jgi:molybdopterin-containing oxidoreductase family membrane subunit
MIFIASWIEKGFGLIVPGFIPGPYGKIAEYTPTGVEVGVTLGIWAMGALIFTMLARTAIGIELGKIRYKKNN